MAELGQLIFGRRQFDTCAKAVLPCQFKGQLRVYTRLMYCFFLSLVLFSTQTGACNEPRNVLRGKKFANKWSIGLAVSSSVVIIGIFGWGMVRQLAIGHPWGGNPNV